MSKDNQNIVDVVAFCLMPNHFHLLVKQNNDGGISKYMRQSINSYAKFFNTKYKRAGSLFQDMFKAVRIESEAQLVHVTRYIHLNPLVSYLVRQDNFLLYPWSSLKYYTDKSESDFVVTNSILALFKNGKGYLQFVLDQADYGKRLEEVKHLLLEEK